MLNRRGFSVAVVGLLAGCGQAPEPPQAGRLVTGRAPHITEDDVELFLAVVQKLPGRMPPAFQPASEVDLTTDNQAAEMVARWQREFRSSYSPQVQARLWKRDARLRTAIDESGLEPEQLATLLVKLSIAIVRDAVNPQIDLADLGRQADRSIASLCSQFDGLDRDPRLSPSTRNARAELLSLVLKETIAYREFLRLLETVPTESVATVGRHREVLRPLMPATETVQAFERRLAAQAASQPAALPQGTVNDGAVQRVGHTQPVRIPVQ